jgi:hypothetical protein
MTGIRRIVFGISKQQQPRRLPVAPPYFRRPASRAFSRRMEWT